MYKRSISKINRDNKLNFVVDNEGKRFDQQTIIQSWKDFYIEKVARSTDEMGLRIPQFGALSAIRAHWATSDAPATIVLPTGTGKTETMYATIISERIKSTLIIVPSNLLREQIFEGASKFGILEKLGMINDNVILPTTFLYKSKVKEDKEDELLSALLEANIIVSTPKMINKLPSTILKKLIEKIDIVIFDEAHHIVAPEWAVVREYFKEKKILQFTATPFRNDGKKIDGKIIFNYGLRLAQRAGYFKAIDFYPIQEFDEKKSDEEIAKIAVSLLKTDLEKGFEHVILARVQTRKRANELFEQIYSKYTNYNPVIVHAGIPKAERDLSMKQIKDGIAKIVVCVDMFGEGIDIPTLKIAAIHDKYKSLPITLQFIGRFARTASKNLGNAKLVTNVAMDDLKESIEELYRQDSDWNRLLNVHSANAINEEVTLGEFISNFEKSHVQEVDLSQLKMKISTRMFKYRSKKKYLDNWANVLDPARTQAFINEVDDVYIFIEEVENNVVWSDQKDIVQYYYEFYVVYFDKENGLVHLNDSDVSKGNKLIEKIFPDASAVKGDSIYRSLDGINRLMLGTLGLKQQPSGRISFRMFAGTDIKAGISEATSSGAVKSNLFGYGFKDGHKISIGCSYKGKVWMRWVERVNFWSKWCKNIGVKILDDTISTDHILSNTLTLEEIKEFPLGVPYKIILPETIEMANSLSKKIILSKENREYHFFQMELRKPEVVNGVLKFEIALNERIFIFEQQVDANGYKFKQVEGDELKVIAGKKTIMMTDYLYENSPEISFVQDDGTVIVVQENLMTVINAKRDIELSSDQLQKVDWSTYGVNIKVESQGRERKQDSIQYATIHNIVDPTSDIIFDDDGAGEIADIVTIKVNEKARKIQFHFYHCKYSSEAQSGARVSDLYEVCGQTEKSIMWNDNAIELIQRMIEREKIRVKNYSDTRFEKGDLETLYTVKKMVKVGFEISLEISIVQPGVSVSKMTSSMKQVILATDTYLKETYAIQLTCYFSH
ncbi:DEAD/DEAH box helicase family protein [Psychrobacillus sp. FSL K6-2684]|uniref:DEAD/DEAH box helicase n=1 Tax=Psychrobacillus sp. FSL K6-2684 TaxID=2921547 RepID=UPI0030F5BD88